MIGRNLITIFFVANCLAQVSQISCNHHDDPFPAIHNVIAKLSAVAEGGHESSGLTLADLQAAKVEWDSWPEEKKDEARQVPMIRLVVDFALTPMSFVRVQLDLSQSSTLKNFIRRLELCYKKFLPGYEGEQLGGGVAIKVKRTFDLYEALEKQQPVSMTMYNAAKREVEAWRARLEDLTQFEDIYANLEELRYLFNFFNFITLKPLWTDVFPAMDSKQTPNAEQLTKLYYQTLERNFNMRFDAEGNLVRYVNG